MALEAVAPEVVALEAAAPGGGGGSTPPTDPTEPTPGETQVVSAAIRDANVMVGGSARIGGTVSPAGNGQLVQLQSWRNGAWVDLKTVLVGSDGGSAPFSFSTTSTRSGVVSYRIHVPAYDGMPATSTSAMKVRYYQAAITGLSAQREWVKITNIGAVALDLSGWKLRDSSNGRVVTLEAMLVKPGPDGPGPHRRRSRRRGRHVPGSQADVGQAGQRAAPRRRREAGGPVPLLAPNTPDGPALQVGPSGCSS